MSGLGLAAPSPLPQGIGMAQTPTGQPATVRPPADPSPLTPEDLAAIARDYPAMAQHLQNTAVQYGNGPEEYQSEFYTPWETDNPNKDKNTVEFYNRKLTPDQLKQLLPAEMLHVMGAIDPRTGQPVDPAWQQLKQYFLATRTPAQMKADMQDYKDTQDPRAFKDYMQQSRGDAYLRAALFPEINPEWNDYLTPDQRGVHADKLRNYLKGQHK